MANRTVCSEQLIRNSTGFRLAGEMRAASAPALFDRILPARSLQSSEDVGEATRGSEQDASTTHGRQQRRRNLYRRNRNSLLAALIGNCNAGETCGRCGEGRIRTPGAMRVSSLPKAAQDWLYLWCTRLLSNKRRESSLLFGPSLDGVAAPV